MARTAESRLFAKYRVDPERGCWLWQGSTNERGYGRIMVKRKRWRVHRLAAVLWLGFDDDPGRDVCHHCDTPACFNPAHLFIGTDQDNMTDKCEKGRQTRPDDPRLYQTARLTPDQVREIRVLGATVPHRELGERYGVSHETVRLAYKRQSFRYVPD